MLKAVGNPFPPPYTHRSKFHDLLYYTTPSLFRQAFILPIIKINHRHYLLDIK